MGIAAVHECAGPGTSSEDDFASVLALSGAGLPQVFGYWGELGGAAKAREMGAVGAAGDLYADGALGSRTASLRSPYHDGPGVGEAFLTAEQAGEHLLDCVSVGVQGGFHAIGDAAIETVLDGFAIAAKAIGVDRLRAGRHRIEHVELADKAMIARMVEFGVVASRAAGVRPAVGRQGPDVRAAPGRGAGAGVEPDRRDARHRGAAGVRLGLAGDRAGPVDGRRGGRRAAQPDVPDERAGRVRGVAPGVAGGRPARTASGVLSPGSSATFAVWDTPAGVHDGLPALLPELDGPRARAAGVPAHGPARRNDLRGVARVEDRVSGKLRLDPRVVRQARALAAQGGAAGRGAGAVAHDGVGGAGGAAAGRGARRGLGRDPVGEPPGRRGARGRRAGPRGGAAGVPCPGARRASTMSRCWRRRPRRVRCGSAYRRRRPR